MEAVVDQHGGRRKLFDREPIRFPHRRVLGAEPFDGLSVHARLGTLVLAARADVRRPWCVRLSGRELESRCGSRPFFEDLVRLVHRVEQVRERADRF